MNQPRADNSPSNANWVTSLPPGWHLKRRGPQQESIQENQEKIGFAPHSVPPEGLVASETVTETQTPEGFNPIASGSDSEGSAFHTILQQADLAASISRPLSPGKVPVQTVRPSLRNSRVPAASIPVATPIETARREVSEIVVSESGRLMATEPDRSTDICQTSPDDQTVRHAGGFVSGFERVDLSGPTDVGCVNNDFVSFASNAGPGIQPRTIETQSAITPTIFEMTTPVKNISTIAVEFSPPEIDVFSNFAPSNEGVTAMPEAVSHGSVPLNFQVVDSPKRAKKIVVKPEQERTRLQAFTHHWFGPDTIGSYSLSTAFHLSVALLLSVVVVFHRETPNEGMGGDSTLISQNGEGIGDGPLDATAINIEPAGGKGEELNTDLLAPQSISGLASNSPLGIGEHAAMAGGGKSGQGNGEGSGVGDGLNIGGYSMGGNAVRKGSFTVWTVPKDPLPREPYLIVIQVKYKKPEQKLVQADITGMVRGTDRYERRISAKTTRIIPEANQVVIEIPGALETVQDSILVHSAILRESQRLQIVF